MTLFFRRTIFILTLILIFRGLDAYGQTSSFDRADRALSELYRKIFPFYYGNNDSLNYYSDLFAAKLTALVKKNPATLNYPFKILIDSTPCNVVTSADGLFRIYSWDTQQGGTAHQFSNIFQYRSGGKVHATDALVGKEDFGSYFTAIYALRSNNKTYYLAISGGSESSRERYETISIFTIFKDIINDKVKLIKTSGGLSNSITVEYDIFNLGDSPEDSGSSIRYDADKKIICIPVVLENGKVTSRYILYQFNGQYFAKIPAMSRPKTRLVRKTVKPVITYDCADSLDPLPPEIRTDTLNINNLPALQKEIDKNTKGSGK